MSMMEDEDEDGSRYEDEDGSRYDSEAEITEAEDGAGKKKRRRYTIVAKLQMDVEHKGRPFVEGNHTAEMNVSMDMCLNAADAVARPDPDTGLPRGGLVPYGHWARLLVFGVDVVRSGATIETVTSQGIVDTWCEGMDDLKKKYEGRALKTSMALVAASLTGVNDATAVSGHCHIILTPVLIVDGSFAAIPPGAVITNKPAIAAKALQFMLVTRNFDLAGSVERFAQRVKDGEITVDNCDTETVTPLACMSLPWKRNRKNRSGPERRREIKRKDNTLSTQFGIKGTYNEIAYFVVMSIGQVNQAGATQAALSLLSISRVRKPEEARTVAALCKMGRLDKKRAFAQGVVDLTGGPADAASGHALVALNAVGAVLDLDELIKAIDSCRAYVPEECVLSSESTEALAKFIIAAMGPADGLTVRGKDHRFPVRDEFKAAFRGAFDESVHWTGEIQTIAFTAAMYAKARACDLITHPKALSILVSALADPGLFPRVGNKIAADIWGQDLCYFMAQDASPLNGGRLGVAMCTSLVAVAMNAAWDAAVACGLVGAVRLRDCSPAHKLVFDAIGKTTAGAVVFSPITLRCRQIYESLGHEIDVAEISEDGVRFETLGLYCGDTLDFCNARPRLVPLDAMVLGSWYVIPSRDFVVVVSRGHDLALRRHKTVAHADVFSTQMGGFTVKQAHPHLAQDSVITDDEMAEVRAVLSARLVVDPMGVGPNDPLLAFITGPLMQWFRYTVAKPVIELFEMDFSDEYMADIARDLPEECAAMRAIFPALPDSSLALLHAICNGWGPDPGHIKVTGRGKATLTDFAYSAALERKLQEAMARRR